MHSNAMDKATSISAVGAVASPYWLPQLHDISTASAELAPILGAMWLTLQIVTFVFQKMKRERKV